MIDFEQHKVYVEGKRDESKWFANVDGKLVEIDAPNPDDVTAEFDENGELFFRAKEGRERIRG